MRFFFLRKVNHEQATDANGFTAVGQAIVPAAAKVPDRRIERSAIFREIRGTAPAAASLAFAARHLGGAGRSHHSCGGAGAESTRFAGGGGRSPSSLRGGGKPGPA